MKKLIKIILIAITSIVILFILLVTIDISFGVGKGKILIPVEHKEVYKNDMIVEFPSRLSVKDNKITDSNGEVVQFKGLMAPDPQKLDYEDNFTEAYYKKIFEAGGNIIRVPVHPDRLVNDKDYLWRYLDPIVTWAGENNNYVIIDLHFIGNIVTGSGYEMPDIEENPKDLTLDFWKQTARYFNEVPNVIFEICNEPAQITSTQWHSCAEEIVAVIRETGAEQLIIVGGIDYSYNLSWVEETPINDDNVAYAAHVFPSKRNWDDNFGDIAKLYPVIITEWGFMDVSRIGVKQQYLIGDEDSFGEPLFTYLEEKDIGWVACWYDDDWEPPMFTRNFDDKTDYGKFVLNKLK